MSASSGHSEAGAQIARGAAVVGAGTLGSRILGMVRDVVIAAHFDRGTTDVFFTAFTIPNVFRRLLGEGAMTPAIVPVYTGVRAGEGEGAARRFVGSAFGLGFVLLVAVALLGAVFSPWIVTVYAWGFQRDPEKFSLCISLTRALWPFLVFIGLCAIAMGILNAHRRFFWPAFSPALLNLAIIAATLAGASRLDAAGHNPVWALAIGVLLGGALQFAAHLLPLRRIDRLPAPSLRSGPAIRQVAGLLGPSVLGMALYQVDILLTRFFASMLDEGSVTYLFYAARLVELPQALFAMAVATAALPRLSQAEAASDRDETKRTWRRSVSMSSFVALPAFAALAVLAEPVVAVLFQRGEFDREMTVHTASALVWCAAGIPGVAGVRNTTQLFFALRDARTPVRLSFLNLVVFVTLCLLLMWHLGHVGIAIASGVTPNVQFAVQLAVLRRRIGPLGLREVAADAIRHAVAAAAMVGACLAAALPARWEEGGTIRNAALLAAVLAAGGAAYFGAAWALGTSDARALAAAVRRGIGGREARR